MINEVPSVIVSIEVLTQEDTIHQYFSSADEVLAACRIAAQRHKVIKTTSPVVARGFMALHGLGELDVTIRRNCGSDTEDYGLDVKGVMINPWPDEFFELDFFLIFYKHDPNG